jgi:GTP:adenosylcobinamide-phosphate guanylyltransferase
VPGDRTRFRSLILAGERPGGSEFARSLGLNSSVLVDVAGESAVSRVVNCVAAVRSVAGALLVGPGQIEYDASPEFSRVTEAAGIDWISQADGPSASVLKGLDALGEYPVFITAADHALLTPAIVDRFCAAALNDDSDVVVGLVPYDLVAAAFPGSRRTVLRFADGEYCGSNLFAVLRPAGRAAPEFWSALEADRKRPWRMVSRLGPALLFRYLTRTSTLAAVRHALEKSMGCTVGIVLVEEARAAVDVDSVADLELACQVLAG